MVTIFGQVQRHLSKIKEIMQYLIKNLKFHFYIINLNLKFDLYSEINAN